MATGKFIAIEGIDGSGLTTQADMLKRWLDKQGRISYLTKEPTDGPAGAIIRLTLSRRLVGARSRANSSNSQMVGLDPATVALLFAADRVDHLTGDVRPKLEKGINVVCDRYWLSSFAYQTVDLDLEWVRQINSRAIVPDLTIFLDIPVEIARKRIDTHRWHVELFEDLDKLIQVRENYLTCTRKLQSEGHKIVPVDANQPVELVHRAVQKVVRSLFAGNATEFLANGQLELINKAKETDGS
jgi:dTMP kinase